MSGLIDLHCHWLPAIDDGARTLEEGLALLAELRKLGFDQVVATPHMRPGMFNNTKADLEAAFSHAAPAVALQKDLPQVSLSSEHYFDDVVYQRILSGEALPYPGGKALLLEFYAIDFPPSIDRLFVEIRRRGLLPIIAHPERYRCLWKKPEILDRLVDLGVGALLDAAALCGKYGSAPRRSADEYLERGIYHAACSDAHRPADAALVGESMKIIRKRFGEEEIDFLFRRGPTELLQGRLPR